MIYLSIDLDYWVHCHERKPVDTFFSHVFALNLPIFGAAFHDQLLEHINNGKYDQVWNIDYHSDICDDGDGLKCNEGTWANYVNHRDTFVWRYPDEQCLSLKTGYCHDTISPFEKPSAAGWKQATMVQGLRGIPWKHISAVGICLSKRWLGSWDIFDNTLQKLGIEDWLTKSQHEIRPRFLN